MPAKQAPSKKEVSKKQKQVPHTARDSARVAWFGLCFQRDGANGAT
jgi:hypothetical protein